MFGTAELRSHIGEFQGSVVFGWVQFQFGRQGRGVGGPSGFEGVASSGICLGVRFP